MPCGKWRRQAPASGTKQTRPQSALLIHGDLFTSPVDFTRHSDRPSPLDSRRLHDSWIVRPGGAAWRRVRPLGGRYVSVPRRLRLHDQHFGAAARPRSRCPSAHFGGGTSIKLAMRSVRRPSGRSTYAHERIRAGLESNQRGVSSPRKKVTTASTLFRKERMPSPRIRRPPWQPGGVRTSGLAGRIMRADNVMRHACRSARSASEQMLERPCLLIATPRHRRRPGVTNGIPDR